MKKNAALKRWAELEPNQPILPHMTPIAYKARGSSYGACGIRIDGNPQFVDSVLSRLQDLIDGENHLTRLGLSRSTVDGAALGKQLDKADDEAEVVYIRLHRRGRQGAMASAAFDRHLHEPTERYEAMRG